MDYPFEYVERVWKYPSFERSEIAKWKTKSEKKEAEPKSGGVSEEDEWYPEDVGGEIIDEKEQQLRKEIDKLTEKLKMDGKEVESSSTCTSSYSDGGDSFAETTDSDVIEDLLTNENDVLDVTGNRFKIMRECACTDSECESNVDLSEDSSESTSSSDSEPEVRLEPGAGEEVSEVSSEDVSSSSEETSSQSDAGVDLEEEIDILEEILEKKLQKDSEKKKTGDAEGTDEDCEQSDWEENEQTTQQQKMKRAQEILQKYPKTLQERKDKKMSMERTNVGPGTAEPTSMEPTAFSAEPTASQLSSSSSSSEQWTGSVGSESLPRSSSATDEDDADSEGIEMFEWDSDDLYASTDTDSELERVLQTLEEAMQNTDSKFAVVATDTHNFEATKFVNFTLPLPAVLKTSRHTYEFMEELIEPKEPKEPKDPKDTKERNVVHRQDWLVQQVETGKMNYARILSRKHPDHFTMQKDIFNERKLLHELRPELGDPSHIARLEDVGCDEDFKYLILEDLGMDLYTVFTEFGRTLHHSSSLFLITYFTFNAIRELHRFDIVHLNVRPSSFSVQIAPFNIKISDYSVAKRIGRSMKTTNCTRADTFSARVFHQPEAEYDEFVDFESWVYMMVFLCTKQGLPWYGEHESILQEKEAFMDDPLDYIYNGCIEAVPMAACCVADTDLSYEEFISRMLKVFAVDSMLYADTDRPLLYQLEEREKLWKRYDGYDAPLDECHWDPADESDSSDGYKTENEKEVYGGLWKQADKEMKSGSIGIEMRTASAEETVTPVTDPVSEPTSKSPLSVAAKQQRPGAKIPTARLEEKSSNSLTPNVKAIAAMVRAPNQIENEEKKRIEQVRKMEAEKTATSLKTLCQKELTVNNLLDLPDIELYATDDSSFSTSSDPDSTVTSFSSWTSSTTDRSDNKRKLPWDLKAKKKRAEPVEFVDAMDEVERKDFDIYKSLVQEWLNEEDNESPSSEAHTEQTDFSEADDVADEVSNKSILETPAALVEPKTAIVKKQ